MSHRLTRRVLLGSAAAVPATTFLNPPANAGSSPAAGPPDLSTRLLTEWAEAPGTHPLIPDISHAGYRGGSRPRRPRVVASVTDFGARPGSPDDCPDAFNRAVEYAGTRGGGTIVVPPGVYRLDSPVWIHWSGRRTERLRPGAHDPALHPADRAELPAQPAVDRQQPLVLDRWADLGDRTRTEGPLRSRGLRLDRRLAARRDVGARTDITLVNNGRVGGSAASGPLFGARIAHWNIRITSGSPYAIHLGDVAPRSITVGLQGLTGQASGLPRDFPGDLENATYLLGQRPAVPELYAAQRQLRRDGA